MLIDRRMTALALVLLASPLVGCSGEITEERGRAAAEAIKDAIKPLDHAAMDQDLPSETVKRLQQELTALKEYQGPVNGKLDTVTINALEAFQRAAGIVADGQVNEETQTNLTAAAAKVAP